MGREQKLSQQMIMTQVRIWRRPIQVLCPRVETDSKVTVEIQGKLGYDSHQHVCLLSLMLLPRTVVLYVC